jgi:hypothetical protein
MRYSKSIHYLLLAPTLTMPLSARDAWEAVLTKCRGRNSESSTFWTFCFRDNTGRAALYAETLFPARVADELVRNKVTSEALEALKRKLGIQSAPDWALVDSHGVVQLYGQGEPNPKALRETMEAGGWRPRWERRQAFLRDHPNQGDAVFDAISEVGQRFLWMRVMVESQRQKEKVIEIPWSPGDSVDPIVAKALSSPFGDSEVVQPYKQSLAWFNSLPLSDPEKSKAWTSMWSLGLGGIQSSSEMTESLRNLLLSLEAQLRMEPTNESLWQIWQEFADLLPGADAESLVASLEPAPCTDWPAPGVAKALVLRMKPQEILERADSELANPSHASASLKAWAPLKLSALIELKQFSAAQAFILDSRIRDPHVFEDTILDKLLDAKNPHSPELHAAFDKKPIVSPKRGSVEHRLLVFGQSERFFSLESIKRSAQLDAWDQKETSGSTELAISIATQEEERALRLRFSLQPEVRWVLLRGMEEVLIKGKDEPDPAQIARVLRSDAPPQIEKLETFLRTHPDHRQGKEKLVELLSARMPHPRLELKLAEACASLGEAPILRGKEFEPHLPLWESAARKALPGAAARLSRWPESIDAWMSWMDWQSVVPRPASPAEHIRSLAIWKTSNRGGVAPLPLDVAAAVAKRLEHAKRWRELGEWGLFHWEGGLRQFLESSGQTEEAISEKRAEYGQLAYSDLGTLILLTIKGLNLSGQKGQAHLINEEVKGINIPLWNEVERILSRE